MTPKHLPSLGSPLAPPPLGVVIVTHNSAGALADCLARLRPFPLPVVVVDNASADESVHIASREGVTLIANPDNRGFAAAANQGFAFLNTPFVLLLNPDVQLSRSPLELLSRFEHPAVGAVAATLLGDDGLPQSEFQFRRFPTPLLLVLDALGLNRLWPSNPAHSRYRYRDADWDLPAQVDQPAGAFLLVRRSAWLDVGGFDEQFRPLWFEDVDFCLRLWRNHWQIWRVPTIVGVHTGGHSIRTLAPADRQLYWYRSLLQYAAKHFSGISVRIIALSILLGSLARALIAATPMRPSPRAKILWPTVALAVYAFISGRPQSSCPVAGSGGSRLEP